MKFFLISVIALALIPNLSHASELTGPYLSVRGIIDIGSTTYQNNSNSLAGWAGELSLGWRPESFIKFGLLGLYENLSLQSSSAIIGPMNMVGGGAMVRLFFVPAVFIEGSGGVTQSNLSTSATGTNLIANGIFYSLGPGLEFKVSESTSLELSFRIRNVNFSQNEFQNMRSVFYSAGFTTYFN